jgi:hypothetical protein
MNTESLAPSSAMKSLIKKPGALRAFAWAEVDWAKKRGIPIEQVLKGWEKKGEYEFCAAIRDVVKEGY